MTENTRKFKQLNIGDVFTLGNHKFLKISTELDNRTDIKHSDLPYINANCFNLDRQHYCIILPDGNCNLIKTLEMFNHSEIED